jgi:hypothetical protein
VVVSAVTFASIARKFGEELMKGGVSRGIEEGGIAYPRNGLVDPS